MYHFCRQLELEANDDRKVLIEAGRVVGLLQLQSFTANELQVLGGFVDLFEPEEMRTQVDEASSSCTQVSAFQAATKISKLVKQNFVFGVMQNIFRKTHFYWCLNYFQVATRSSGRHNSGKKDKSKKGDKSKSGHGKKNSNAKHNQTTLPPPVSSTQLYGNLDDDVDFNEIVCSIGPFELTHESLKSLESEPSKHDRRLLSHLFSGHFSNGFIESKAINACIWLLCRDQRTLSFFPAESVYYMMDPKTTFPVKNKLPPLDINTREVTTFVMPILKNKQHWLLMLYDVRKNRLQLLDSKEPVGENSLDDETLQLIMYNLFTGWHVDAREAEVFQVKCAQQDSQDQASCGAFVVHFVQCLINGLPFTTPCNPQQMRRVMFESIIEEAHILVD